MPYSKSQLRWAFATNQPFAKKWAKEVNYDSLPESTKKYEHGDNVQSGFKNVIKQPVTLQQHRENLNKFRKKTYFGENFSDPLMKILFNRNNQFMLRSDPNQRSHMAGFKKTLPGDIGAAIYGSTPAKKNPWYKGFIGGSIAKQFGDFNASVGLEREILSGKMIPKANLRYTKRFDKGGHAHPHTEKPQINYARQDNTRLSGFGDAYAGETKETDYTSIPTIHDALDQASFIPYVGEAADVANAALYLKKGEYENAAWASAGLVLPFVGGKALKAGYKGAKKAFLKRFGKADDFASEIDWGKWHKEIPGDETLMKEYKAIEKATKGNKTWMTNPDGSAFKGTPEQFVQQQSNNFKKAFGESKLLNPDGSPTIQYHGTAKEFDTFDPKMFQTGDSGYSGLGIYTSPNRVGAESYAVSSAKNHTGEIKPTVMEMYGLGKNPIRTHDLPEGFDLFDFHRPRNWAGDVPLEKQLLDHDVAIRTQRGGTHIAPDHMSHENVFPTNTQLKSSTGNRGTFDMRDPNIYKKMGGPIEKYTEGSDVTLPEASSIYDPDATYLPKVDYLSMPPATVYADRTSGTYRTKMLKAANKMVEDEIDITRGPAGRYENFMDYIGLQSKWKDNTCVECVKEAENMAGIEGGIPDSIMDNRNFWKYHRDYGYKPTDNPGPGSVLQFTTEPNKKLINKVRKNLGKDYSDQLIDYGYPIHIGIMKDDSTYINDGHKWNSVYEKTLFDEDGTRKRYHGYDKMAKNEIEAYKAAQKANREKESKEGGAKIGKADENLMEFQRMNRKKDRDVNYNKRTYGHKGVSGRINFSMGGPAEELIVFDEITPEIKKKYRKNAALRHNNPGNIMGWTKGGKKTAFAKYLEGQGINFKKGSTNVHGTFLDFSDEGLGTGLKVKQLFWQKMKTNPMYRDLTVDQALRLYSGGGSEKKPYYHHKDYTGGSDYKDTSDLKLAKMTSDSIPIRGGYDAKMLGFNDLGTKNLGDLSQAEFDMISAGQIRGEDSQLYKHMFQNKSPSEIDFANYSLISNTERAKQAAEAEKINQEESERNKFISGNDSGMFTMPVDNVGISSQNLNVPLLGADLDAEAQFAENMYRERGGNVYARGAEVVDTETVTEQVAPQGVTETVTETEAIEEAPKPKKPLTPLDGEESKKFNLWRKAWGIKNDDFMIDMNEYDIPAYFKSNAWKIVGSDYKSDLWKR